MKAMSNFGSIRFDSIVELEEYLILFLKRTDLPTAIMGGHFMLAYDSFNDRLAPIIRQDSDTTNLKNLADLYAGDFPLRSFKLAVSTLVKSNNDENKIFFLVNDHKFHDKNFQPNCNDMIKGRTGSLRRDFYRQYKSIPKSYRAFCDDLKIDADRLILQNNDNKRSGKQILPKVTCFYSEQVLRNKFDNTTRNKIKTINQFSFNGLENSKQAIYFESKITGCRKSLTEFGRCGCGGEILELLLHLYNIGFQSCILISPEECEFPIFTATEAAIFGLGLGMNTIVISGVGGAGETINSSWQMTPKAQFINGRDSANKQTEKSL